MLLWAVLINNKSLCIHDIVHCSSSTRIHSSHLQEERLHGHVVAQEAREEGSCARQRADEDDEAQEFLGAPERFQNPSKKEQCKDVDHQLESRTGGRGRK